MTKHKKITFDIVDDNEILPVKPSEFVCVEAFGREGTQRKTIFLTKAELATLIKDATEVQRRLNAGKAKP